MAVKVSRGLRSSIRKYPGSIVVLVQGVSETDAAAAALREARAEIAGLDGGWQSVPNLNPGDTNSPKYVGAVASTSIGLLLSIDGGYTPAELLATIPDIITRHLADAGVTDAGVTEPPTEGPLWGGTGFTLNTLPHAVVLYLYPPAEPNRSGMLRARATVPPTWLDDAAAWLRAGVGDERDEVWVATLAQYPVPPEAIRDAFDEVRRSGSGQVVAGNMTTRIRAADTNAIGYQWLSLSGGGPAATEKELLATFEDLTALARRLAPDLAYACISVEPTFGARLRNRLAGWSMKGGASPDLVMRIPDEIVLDAFPAQILGPGHLARLSAGGVHLDTEAGVTLRCLMGDRVELSIGQPSWWLADHPQRAVVDELAHRILAPCMVGEERAIEIYQAKLRAETS